ncbi:MAG: hypothetical protein ACI9S8_000750 [Chlamydiales bacterium]|jgi:hypothetical protein
MNQNQLLSQLKFLEQVQISSSNRNVIVLANPKSGGSFFHFALIEVLRYKKNQFTYKGGFSHHNLYWPKVLAEKASGQNTVAHHHSLGNQDNIYSIQRGQLIPIVLSRNIFDTIVSLRDHLSRAKPEETGWFFSVFPPSRLKNFKLLSNERQLDFLIERFCHLFFDFYISWKEAAQYKVINPLFITYEELIGDKVGTVIKAANFIGEEVSEAMTLQCVLELEKNRKREIRFNEGRIGRGKEVLSEEQVKKICKISEFYHSFDLEGLGIFQKQRI